MSAASTDCSCSRGGNAWSCECRATRDAKSLARLFVRLVNRDLTAEELGEVRFLNKTDGYAGCCATHDFVDANMVMLEAYSVASCTPANDVDVSDEAVQRLMNAAWDLARAAEFRAEDVK